MLTDIQIFEIFNWDLGVLMGDDRLVGANLYELRPRQRSGKVIDWDTISPEELGRIRGDERRARVEKMAELCTPEKLDELERLDKSPCSLLDPPEFI